MSSGNVHRSLACGMGRFLGGTLKALTSVPKALRKSVGKLRPQPSREKIRTIVTEELIHLVGKETELTRRRLEERLQVMTQTILALQERINEPSARGPVSEADMWEAVGSLEAAESLTDDERAILVNVFRQNIALQKPKLVGVAID